MSSIELAGCNVPEKLNKVRLCEALWVRSSYILFDLRRAEQSETIHVSRRRREKRGLVKAWKSAAAICSYSDSRRQGISNPTSDYAGKYRIHVYFHTWRRPHSDQTISKFVHFSDFWSVPWDLFPCHCTSASQGFKQPCLCEITKKTADLAPRPFWSKQLMNVLLRHALFSMA